MNTARRFFVSSRSAASKSSSVLTFGSGVQELLNIGVVFIFCSFHNFFQHDINISASDYGRSGRAGARRTRSTTTMIKIIGVLLGGVEEEAVLVWCC